MSERTVYNGGVPGNLSQMIAARMTADTAHCGWITVLWYGNVNRVESEQIKADLRRSVAWLGANRRFVVLSVINAADTEHRGTAAYVSITRLNAELGALYPDNFLDIRSYLVNLYNPALIADHTDFARDVPPFSLRWDDIHLNADGHAAAARRISEFITSRGW
jgi:hypothetical protein